jgi:DNA helicase-2/ATP-dependent DNA helicase PcrA
MTYTDSQQKAIDTIDKNLQIIACAGSGKTQVISMRIVNILRSDISPKKIIAFTYTEKAAAELNARISKLVKQELGEVRGISEMYVGTIHSWCLRVLQDLCYKYQKFSILDSIKLKLFVDAHYRAIGMLDMNMKQFRDTDRFISVMGIIRESEIAEGHQIPQNILNAKTKYEKCLTEHCYLDFTMIMSKALDHLRNDAHFRSKLLQNIGYLVVDEYQDVNPIQECIISGLNKMGANICTVGDDDQTLYQWRGSDVHMIQHFRERYSDVEFITLENNFRSTHGVIDYAIKTISNNTERIPKKMIAKGHQSYEQGDVLYNQYDTVEDEYNFIASTIKSLRGTSFKDKSDKEPRGLDYSDFAILLRTWKKAEGIIGALEKNSIPYVVKGVNGLFQRKEIVAAQSIFQFLDNKVSEDDVIHLWHNVHQSIAQDKIKQAVEYLKTKYPKKNSYYERFNLQEIYHTFLDKTGINEDLFAIDGCCNSSGYKPEEVVFYNLGMFSQIINDYETIHFKDDGPHKLSRFLSFLFYSADGYYPEGWLSNSDNTPNAVQILTIHQSKGLEFPVVFIPGFNKNYLPIKGIGGRTVWHEIDINLIKDGQRYKGGEEDERRLLYVAITRSQKFLFITRAPENGNRLYQQESPFGAEIRQAEHYLSSKERKFDDRNHITPKPLNEVSSIALNFSLLKDFFECPWRFKFYSIYGFVNPLGARMGYGNTIHNALMEIHREALDDNFLTKVDIPRLLDTHAHFPNALDVLEKEMTKKAGESLEVYLDNNAADFENIEFAEKDIQLDLGDGILVNGRMDLIKKKQLDGTYKTTIIDFKSTSDTQQYQASHDQLALYALGYQELTGEMADFLEIYNLDDNTPNREELRIEDLSEIRQKIKKAADKIRDNHLEERCENPKCACRFKSAR